MYTVRLRHWQAAACIAATLSCSVPQGVAQAPQQGQKTQAQLEAEFYQAMLASKSDAAKKGTSAATTPAAATSNGTLAPAPVRFAPDSSTPATTTDSGVVVTTTRPSEPLTTPTTARPAAAVPITNPTRRNVPPLPPAPAAATTPAPTVTAPAAVAPSPAVVQPAALQQAPSAAVEAATPKQTQVSPTKPVAAGAIQNDTTGNKGLPQAPGPKLTEPLFMRPSEKDYGKGKPGYKDPLLWYTSTGYPQPRLSNTPRLDDLLQEGKIYLSLSDAVTLALENNYDIAIARINLDIADTDLLRAKAGSSLRGVSTGVVANTLGGSTTTITGGGGPGGTSSGTGGTGAGASGLVLSTNGGGPTPEARDPLITGTFEYENAQTPQTNLLFSGGLSTQYTHTATYNAVYQQGFATGTLFSATFNNSRVTTNNPFTDYSPTLTSSVRFQATQHLLQGFGPGINSRFILQAKNDRRITDSAFRQQLLYTINQVENIYWSLVSAYEDEQAKERSLAQSTKLSEDNRKQLQIGTLAPLDIVNSDATVATDKQALIQSQTNLEYQQLVMKQAIARNLNDPQLATAPVIPTDRVGLDRLPEEDMAVEDLVRDAYQNNPQIEQAVLNMKNNQITIKAEKNGLLPTVDAFAFYGGSGIGGAQNPTAENFTTGAPYAPGTFRSIGIGSVLQSEFNNSSPDKGVGVNVTIPLRNRTAQADQVRSQMELRQSEMRLQQLYTQIRIQVINSQYALTNDRAQVAAAQASRDYQAQSYEAEQKKYKLGASTTALVLQQGRSLAIAENSLISATAAYARDRAALLQLLSNTLDRYGISIGDAASGRVTSAPTIPGLTAPKAPAAPKPLTSTVR
jgi:outer membrane protein TolC